MADISRQQSRLLEGARRSRDPFRVVRSLYEMLTEHSDEPLHPEWKNLWEANYAEIISTEIAPESVVKRIEREIKKIDAIDGQIKQLTLKPTNRVCLLLGAGASAPEPSSIPTVANLLPELLRRAGKIGREDLDRLADWCNEHKIDNIEDLLTAAHLADFAAKSSSVTDLLDYFLFRASSSEVESGPLGRRRSPPRVNASSIALLQDTLQVLFGLLTGTMIPARPNAGHEAVVNFVKKHPKSSIVTTNYDGCVDEALIRANVPVNTYIDETGAANDSAIDLVKIHGSINWSYCDSCHDVRDFSLLDLKAAYESDTTSFAVIGICKNCGGQRRPLLIPPMGLKFIIFPNLINLWNTARISLETADHIIVVGFSFSEADTYINKIVERSMTRKSNQRLIVCDPNWGLVRNLRRLYSARIDGFDESRILSAQGSAEKILPEVLDMLLDSRNVSSSSKKSPATSKQKAPQKRKSQKRAAKA